MHGFGHGEASANRTVEFQDAPLFYRARIFADVPVGIIAAIADQSLGNQISLPVSDFAVLIWGQEAS